MNRPNFPLTCNSYLLFGIAVLSVFLLQRCEKEPEPFTTDSLITGRVYIQESGVQLTDISVTATGPYGSRTTQTDGNGIFIFRGMGNGTYYLDYSKEGFGKVRQHSIQVFGGDTVKVQDIILFQKPGSFTMPEMVKAYIKNEPYGPTVRIETKIENYFDYPVIFFLDTNPDVSWKINAHSVHGFCTMLYTNPSVVMFEIQVYDFPFESGSTVYARAYPCNIEEWNYSGYIDIYKGVGVLTTLDKSRPSNVVSFTMP